ncbi:MAG: hypothetical protein ACTSU5_21720 [Promethearchaeota archaeon]
MFRRYLLKQKFWQSRKNDRVVFVKHDSRVGGIYARLLRSADGRRGVEIKANGEEKFFDNFTDLDRYLETLTLPSADPMFSVLGRRNNERFFRQLTL